ncbi:MAG: ABC transporter permease [Euryarchaeota archaeon]|nr:ABC transporter permease [Euryarchaeota archaeon]
MGLLTISKWELRRTKRGFGKKTIAFSLLLVLLIGIVSFFIAQYGFHLNDNLYKVVATDPEIGSVVGTDSKFEVYIAEEAKAREMFQQGGFDILIIGQNVSFQGSERSISAMDALDKAVIKYDENRLLSYNDLNNTFPVWITINNIPREQAFAAPSLQKLPELEPEFEPSPETITSPAPTPASAGTPVKGTAPTPSISEVKTQKNVLPIKENALSTPSHFNPPIPFRSVVLSFLFIFPMYFIAQLFSASIMEERVKRKGELLLVSPVSSWEIVLGKLVPYLVLTLVLMGGIALYIGGNLWMLLILLPMVLMFLSTAFLGAIISRSFKELTFVLVFLSVSLSGYIFLPAMFSNIHAISMISPMTLVVKMLEAEAVTAQEYLFSTLPFYLVSILIFTFGIFIYREEDLFTQRSVKGKLLDSVQVFLQRIPAPIFFLSIALLPLVYSVQLILIVVMFNFPIRIGIVVFIFMAAFIEEVVKSVGIYTAFSRKMSVIDTRTAIKAGISSGTGFFLGEKLLLLAVIAGISGSVFGSAMGIGLLVFPFILHVSGAMISALGLRYLGTGKYILSVILATVVHAGYNLYIVRGVFSG